MSVIVKKFKEGYIPKKHCNKYSLKQKSVWYPNTAIKKGMGRRGEGEEKVYRMRKA